MKLSVTVTGWSSVNENVTVTVEVRCAVTS
jgi:hypothetical protein